MQVISQTLYIFGPRWFDQYLDPLLRGDSDIISDHSGRVIQGTKGDITVTIDNYLLFILSFSN